MDSADESGTSDYEDSSYKSTGEGAQTLTIVVSKPTATEPVEKYVIVFSLHHCQGPCYVLFHNKNFNRTLCFFFKSFCIIFRITC